MNITCVFLFGGESSCMGGPVEGDDPPEEPVRLQKPVKLPGIKH